MMVESQKIVASVLKVEILLAHSGFHCGGYGILAVVHIFCVFIGSRRSSNGELYWEAPWPAQR